MATKVKLFVLFPILLVFKQCLGSDYSRCPIASSKAGSLKIYNSRCYQFIKVEVDWFRARQFCLDRGGDLITIHRRDIQMFVERSLREIHWSRNGMWIGATDKDDEMNWKWVTGQRVSDGYHNWDSSQPNCWLPDAWCKEDCACLRLDEGYKWHDYFCAAPHFEYGFVCQYDMLPPTRRPPLQPVTLKMEGNNTSSTRKTTTTSEEISTTQESKPTSKPTSPTEPKWVTMPEIKATVVKGDYAKSGSPCSYGNRTYKSGEQFPDIDNCNRCHCYDGHVGCTEMACIREGKDCFYDGKIAKTGDRFRVSDECNWCYCNDGQVNCTETYCGPLGTWNQIGVQSQQVSSQDEGLKTGSVVGMVISFVLVFVAGLVVGIFLCKRRYKKRYEDNVSAGFSNVLYTATPQQTQSKQANLYMSEPESDFDEEPPHYTSIDNIHVPPPYSEAATGSNIYADVDEVKKMKPVEESVGEEELTVVIPPPAPCGLQGEPEIQQEDLRQTTDGVSEAYSNNLYGVQ